MQNAITDNQYVTIGVEQHKTDYLKNYSNPSTDDYKAKGTTQDSIYAQDKISFNGHTLTIGARYDDNSQFGNDTSGSIGYVHSLTDNMFFKTSLGTAYKAPNIKEADSNYSFSSHSQGIEFRGNDDLDAETSRNAEIALVGSTHQSDWSVALYYTKIKDMIVSQDTGATNGFGHNIYEYRNIDDATIKGIELGYNFDISDTMFLDSSFSKMDTEDDDGDELPFRPETMAKVKLSKEFSHDFLFSVSANYTGTSYDGANNKVDSYTLYDAVLNKQMNDYVSLQLAVTNLSDEKLEHTKDNHMSELLGREIKASFSINY